MLLGPTQYLAFATVDFLSAFEKGLLEEKLRNYRSCAYARSLSKHLQVKSQSFVGRDLKLMVEQLPVILKDLLHNKW